MVKTSTGLTALAVGIALSLSSEAVLAGGTHGDAQEVGSIGSVGNAGHVDREIHIEMGEMYFSPLDVEIEKGETIRFVVKNVGDFVHEFNLATEEMHLNHSEEMMMMFEMGVLEADRINRDAMATSEMVHSDPNSILLEPNETGEVIWTFNGDAKLELSCNIPGHRESGMIGSVEINL